MHVIFAVRTSGCSSVSTERKSDGTNARGHVSSREAHKTFALELIFSAFLIDQQQGSFLTDECVVRMRVALCVCAYAHDRARVRVRVCVCA